LRPLAAALAEKLAEHRPEVICGPLTGGAFLAQMMALELDASFCFSERIVTSRPGLYPVDYRIPLALHGDLRGRRVAVVDDAISAGSAVRGTLSALDGADANPIAIAALIVIGPRARVLAEERAAPLEMLRQLPDAIWTPDECPRCATGEALVVP
jgi:orotate phosphoribosyltransferase